MESWMLSLGIAVAGSIAAFAVTRHLVATHSLKIKAQEQSHKDLKENEIRDLVKFKDESSPLLTHLSKAEDALRAKIDSQAEAIVALKEKANNAATMKEVRTEFVSKELFLALEKHIDSRFTNLEKKMDIGFESIAAAIKEVK